MEMGGKKPGQPMVIIIAGPNGAGKSTFAERFLPNTFGDMPYLNADMIAKEISPEIPSAALRQAGELFLRLLDAQIAARQDFAFETTLSGVTLFRKIPLWREQGWYVVLIYLYLENVQLSQNRVQMRVVQGGHDIPDAQIIRRYPRSVRNLFKIGKCCDRTFCLDNSHFDIKVILEQSFGGLPEVKDEGLYQELLKESLNNE